METTRRRTQPREVRREQLLDAAERVLTGKGLAAMTVADVAEAAGLGKGTVYLYFDSKEQLVAALQARYNDALVEAASRSLRRSGSHLGRLDAFLAQAVDFHRERTSLHHVLFHEAGMGEADSMRRLEDLLAGFIAEGAAAGAFATPDATFSARFLLHGLHGVLVPFLHDPEPNRARFLAAAGAACRSVLGAPSR